MKDLVTQQIELEKKMTETSVEKYRRELEKSKQNKTFGCSSVATKLISAVLEDYGKAIDQYKADYSKGKAIRSTVAAAVISRFSTDVVAFVSSKIILNSLWIKVSIQAIYKAIGQALEDEYKMSTYKEENAHYYKTIQEDLNRRGAKAQRKKNITTGVFNKRLGFHLERWTVTEKFQTGLVLLHLFVEATGFVVFEDVYRKRKHYKTIIPTQEFVQMTENLNVRLEVMSPLFLPMVCPPKEWAGILEGGYISPYLRKNKIIKNNDKEYLKLLQTSKMEMVYTAVNQLQSTKWQINTDVLDVVEKLWKIGKKIAELPNREDEPLPVYPYPEKDTKRDDFTTEEREKIKEWKRKTYETYKRNVQKRSIRLLVSQIIRIARQFKDYENIWFPYQMDFRGRLYPIPVLLQPQGSDLAKGLLRFGEGKAVSEEKDEETHLSSADWLAIHGANMYGYDKESYEDRIKWVKERVDIIKSYAENPVDNQGWAEADKPFQFLAWCFEYRDFVNNPDTFTSKLPIQLDGTCNGLQHYSALLRDPVGGAAVNLVNTEKPSDIYAKVAERLEDKLNELRRQDSYNLGVSPEHSNDNIDTVRSSQFTDNVLARRWLDLGINRKLTKRPVMVLPYGGTRLSCREYIGEYLTDNYSNDFIWSHFKVGDNPTDCIFKVSTWLSKYLWESITDTLKAAVVGMDYLRRVARILTREKKYIEWLSPAGLLVRQGYRSRKSKEIKTELYGSILKTRVGVDTDIYDSQRQVNGICPNFIHSLDAACLMFYLNKCKKEGINSIMSVHDDYATHAADTNTSAKLLRESFVEIYQGAILENFTEDVLSVLDVPEEDRPEKPERGELKIEEVLHSQYFFN